MTYTALTFRSGETVCDAWHFRGAGDRFASPSGRPVVVMAHGIAGTKDSGLEPFGRRLSNAGVDVVAFDYRGFGASGGEPRQTVSVARQVDDYRAAVSAVRRLPDVDPGRVLLWGVSFSGGHVLRVAANDGAIAGVIALTPLTSGAATSRLAIAQCDLVSGMRWTAAGVKGRLAAAMGGSATFMPVVGRPGEAGALTLDGAYENYLSMAGPTWRNEIDAGVGLQLALVRSSGAAAKLRCPLLVQIADFDRFVPAESIAKVAVRGRAEVHHYPCDHFDVWPGNEWFDKVVDHQIAFIARTLARNAAQMPSEC
ncbi:alpha/beta hydrolase [Candidatus Mycobacterium wuenschmannii]|uniref:Alpha/beta hydrolase n=1 Tax=Candidatus Mycobacterium wuenschmannii TaxID=3027808 RepID=A0ABY8W358_9MYCO|nr:alpha/beta hydrolase [Candidatus Mycobacterium wuenschmannii]WIM89635.1 alpha/beta hydrolase [Candidatus Mycobacterium wuenschmannii]